MDKDTLIPALQKKIKETDMDIPETVHYNAGIIDAIKEVKHQYALDERKKQTP